MPRKEPKPKVLWRDSSGSWRIVQTWFPNDAAEGADWVPTLYVERVNNHDAMGEPVWEDSDGAQLNEHVLNTRVLSELLVKAGLLKEPIGV